MTRRSHIAVFLAGFSSVFSAEMVAAAETEFPSLSINGYGTLGVVHSSDDNADYLADLFRPNGPGHTREWSVDVDSRIGLQVSSRITPKLSAILQLITEQQHDNSYDPDVEWANLQYRFTPDFSVRVGRFVQPTFLFAETRKVGYTYPWVRPPNELYGLVPVSHNDGIEASYRMQFGEVIQSLDASYGHLSIPLPDRLSEGETEADDNFSVMSTTEIGSTTLRISYHQTRLTVASLGSLFDAFRQFGPEGAAIANRYDVDGDRLESYGVGVKYDPGEWFAIGEWGTTDFHNVFGERSAWYLSAGYRFGTLTPYASFARLNNEAATSAPGLTLASLPPPLVGPATGLNAALNGILGEAPAQKTVTAGIRWDFMIGFALKLQYESVRRDDGSPGTFGNLQPGFEPGGDADLFSASIDFVF